jgi:hypothetical protein
MPLDTPDFEAELERAIATYADPHDSGHPKALTALVMCMIEARRRKKRWWLSIAVAVPVLGCLLIAALPYREHLEIRYRTAVHMPVASIANRVVTPKASSPPNLEVVRRQTTHHQAPQLPKLDQFPTPSAPTEQEQVLMQFIAHASPNTQELVAKARTQPNESLHIAELRIPYLDSNTKPQ